MRLSTLIEIDNHILAMSALPFDVLNPHGAPMDLLPADGAVMQREVAGHTADEGIPGFGWLSAAPSRDKFCDFVGGGADVPQRSDHKAQRIFRRPAVSAFPKRDF